MLQASILTARSLKLTTPVFVAAFLLILFSGLAVQALTPSFAEAATKDAAASSSTAASTKQTAAATKDALPASAKKTEAADATKDAEKAAAPVSQSDKLPPTTNTPATEKASDSGYLSGVDSEKDIVRASLPRTIFNLVLSLAIITGLIYLVVWLLKKFGYGGRFAGGPSGSLIRTISSSAISPQHSVQIISVGGKVLVVGLYEKGMTLLGEVTDAESLEQIQEELDQKEESFADMLAGVRGDTKITTPKEWVEDKINALRLITARTAGGRTSTKGRSPGMSASQSKVVSLDSEKKVDRKKP